MKLFKNKQWLFRQFKRFFLIFLSTALAVLIIRELGVYYNPFNCALIETLPQSKMIKDRQGQVFWNSVSEEDSWQLPVRIEQVSPLLIKAVIAAEDAQFYQHGGVDPVAVVRAGLKALRARRITSGASTLSMQLVKMAHLKQKSAQYKFVQMCEATSLERQRSKAWILEHYLNMAPFGSNIIGIEAASRYYFRKKAIDLNLYEASLLAGLPQRPSFLRPDRYPHRAKKRQQYVLQMMLEQGFIGTIPEASLYKKEDSGLAESRLGFCQRDQELADMIGTYGETTVSMDTDLQDEMRRLLNRHLEQFDDISNGSLIVQSNKTAEVLALIGHTGGSLVNAALTPRSSGSVLKPFIYLDLIDEGRITSASIIRDEQLNLKAYNVRNFGGDFTGDVTVQKALTSSLNTPAIKALALIGVDPFLQSLKFLGFSTLDRPAEDYGLSLALGGGEVNLLELVNAYCCLANRGNYRPWKLLKKKEPIEKQLYNPAAVDLLTKMLFSKSIGPGFQDRLAWKTGTSNGFRDAWCVAYNDEYTVGVWLGNQQGAASRSLIGAKSAAPLVAKIFNKLYPSGVPPFRQSDLLTNREVCAVSGLLPVKYCLKKTMTSTGAGVELLSCRQHLHNTEIDTKGSFEIHSPEGGNYSCIDQLRLQLKSTDKGSWFINGKYCGVGNSWRNFSKGSYTIRCVAAHEVASVEIVVR